MSATALMYPTEGPWLVSDPSMDITERSTIFAAFNAQLNGWGVSLHKCDLSA